MVSTPDSFLGKGFRPLTEYCVLYYQFSSVLSVVKLVELLHLARALRSIEWMS